MTERKRAYASDLRAEQARRTRRQIVTAGGRLFAAHGYVATTVDAIAKEAGVSRKTVFTAVGGKPVILKLAHDWAIGGDDDPVALEERDQIMKLRQETDPIRLLEGYVDHLVVTHERFAPIYCAMRNAADADPEAAALFEESKQQRLTGMSHFAAHLEEVGLRPGLSRRRATDLLFHLIDPGHYETLVLGRGWSLASYRAFMLASLKLHLLGLVDLG